MTVQSVSRGMRPRRSAVATSGSFVEALIMQPR
jgi:hypothetical protein